ncbi:MAG: LLM class F420-dependent oxidoreductase [Alphaproteobacteria bacterium]|nr:LLM class F420-dependent oxidoreductase [Alphaproteobacteria bacterium]MDP6564674.1 LLM class F420-dependent oxidoreductase [Alphaproteobacteria bacterium]
MTDREERSMEFGAHFANFAYPEPDRAIALCTAAERVGFDFAVTIEHVVWPTDYDSPYPYSPSGKLPGGPETNLPDPLIWMAHAAAHTERLRFMTGVLILPQRNPLIVAKQVASLDYLSNGRIELGIGVGWLEEEFDALGVPFARRGKRTDEYIEAMRVLWTQDDAGYDGEFVNFQQMNCNPKPVQARLPIIIGGHSELAARRAGRLGDGFFPATGWAGDRGPLLELVRDEAIAHGRDPGDIRITTGLDPDDPVDSTLRVAEQGFHRVVVNSALFSDDLAGELERFGAEVIAPVREKLGG